MFRRAFKRWFFIITERQHTSPKRTGDKKVLAKLGQSNVMNFWIFAKLENTEDNPFLCPSNTLSTVKAHLNKLGIQLLCKTFDLFGAWPSYLFIGATTLHVSFWEEACKYSHPQLFRNHCPQKFFLTHKWKLTLSSFVPDTPYPTKPFCSSYHEAKKIQAHACSKYILTIC